MARPEFRMGCPRGVGWRGPWGGSLGWGAGAGEREKRFKAPRITSLASVGGSAMAARSANLALKRNNLLKEIVKNTKGRQVAVFA